MSKAYLGDAVYVELDRFGAIVLTTEDGIRATNRIVLEPEVVQAFGRWLTLEPGAVAIVEKLADEFTDQ